MESVGTVFKEDSEQTRRLKYLLVELVAKYEVQADVILLAWILRHPAAITPVSGSCSIERLKNQLKATTLQLDLQDWFAIWTESMGTKVP